MKKERYRLLQSTVLGTLMMLMMGMSTLAAQKEEIQLGDTEHTWWYDDTTAAWKSVKHARAYQVRLYEDDSSVVRLTVDNTRADFSQYMKDGCQYYFEVRAVAKNSEQSYVRDGNWVSSEPIIMTTLGDTTGRWRNYQEGKKYQLENGSYANGGWLRIRGDWYYFNQEGYSVSGWFLDNGKWYFTDSDGIMKTGWLEQNGRWYYLNHDGAMATGWVEVKPGQWYYLYSDGCMARDTVIDGYQVDGSGMRVS